MLDGSGGLGGSCCAVADRTGAFAFGDGSSRGPFRLCVALVGGCGGGPRGREGPGDPVVLGVYRARE